jgi:hypothetical protein
VIARNTASRSSLTARQSQGSPARNQHGHLIEMPPRRQRLRCETAQKES